MTSVSDKPCWEIMRCSGTECVARRHPEIPCWEHAKTLNYTVCAHGVCPDCIVFVAKKNPAIFNEQQLTTIFSHPKIYGRNQPKYPSQITRQRLGSLSSKKRQLAYARMKGATKTVIANKESSVCQLFDLSHKGLSFSNEHQSAWNNQSIYLDIGNENFSLSNLSAQIITGHPYTDSAEE